MENATSLKLLSSNELKNVRDFAHDSFVELYNEVLSNEVISQMKNWLFDTNTFVEKVERGNLFYLYSENDVPLAYLSFEPIQVSTNELRIHSLHVLPFAQNRGVGKLLMQKAIDIAHENNISKLVFVTNRFSLSITFFKHLGFTIKSKEKIDIGNGLKIVNLVLEYELAPSNGHGGNNN